MSSGRRA